MTDQSTNAPTMWNWTFSGGTPATSTLSNPTVVFASAGAHTVTLISSNSVGASTASSKTLNVSTCTGIDENEAEVLNVSVFPNPGHGRITLLSGNTGLTEFSVYSLLGQEIGKGQLEENSSTTIDIENHPKGIYFIKLTNKGTTSTVKIIKE
jgi:PKD repeat protein